MPDPPRLAVAVRPVLGILLVFLLLLGGRLIRARLLVGPEGRWRDPLWLDELVLPAETVAAEPEKKRPVLTAPLPINSCSTDSLTLLPGVGPVLAARIDEARTGGLIFRAAADLRRVKGIGKKLSARLDTLVVYAASADSAAQPVAGPAAAEAAGNSE